MSQMIAEKLFFHADHVGSLLRPAELLRARSEARQGNINFSLRAIEDKCIREVVALQESIGFKIVTDGEFRRDWWHIDFLHGFDGVELSTSGDVYRNAKFKNTDEQPPTMMIEGKIRRSEPSMLDHFRFLKSVAKHTPRFTMPSPAMLHGRADRASLKKAYPDLDEFWADLTAAYRSEIRDLYNEGCRYLQIDDTTIAMMSDPAVQERFRQMGDDPKTTTRMYADAVNAALRDAPEDLTVGIHTCRGNFKSTFLATGSYDFVADTVFSKLNVDTYFLEYDSERCGSFEPLRLMPRNKKVVIGLVSSKFPAMESRDELKRKIDEVARYVSMENLGISPQCGFSSTHHGNVMTIDQQVAKLRHCVETATEIWGGMK
jgi:5-methyltetrahydropteroyltriglutamate--homocysteine methyltransferase